MWEIHFGRSSKNFLNYGEGHLQIRQFNNSYVIENFDLELKN